MNILVVDDEPFQSEVLAMVLKKAGHGVKTTSSGALALAALAQGSFGVVITDLSMPLMDGLTLAREIRANNPSQAIILLTGSGTQSDAMESVNYSLAKPVDVEKLLEILGGLGAEH